VQMLDEQIATPRCIAQQGLDVSLCSRVQRPALHSAAPAVRSILFQCIPPSITTARGTLPQQITSAPT